MAGEKREFKTGDFVLCKWDVDTDDGGRENGILVPSLVFIGNYDGFVVFYENN